MTVEFYWDCGRAGAIESLFFEDPRIIDTKLIRVCYGG